MNELIITIVADLSQYRLDEHLVNKIFQKLERKKGSIIGFSWLSTQEACDIEVQDINKELAYAAVINAIEENPVDIFIQEKSSNRRKKFLISDMDSTIIEQECIDELADTLGLKEEVSAITAKAMNGELDFPSALRERVALLENLKESDLQKVYDDKITFMPGAKTLIQTMKKSGAYCLLVSGGFTFFTEKVKNTLGFDDHKANILDFNNGLLTGKVIDPILDKQDKLDSLNYHVARLNIADNDVISLGDGANDLPMLKAAGLAIAHHAKQAVKDVIPTQINHTNLESALFAQGFKRDEFIF